MTKARFTPAYPDEFRERSVRLFQENCADYTGDTAAYRAIAPKLAVHLTVYVRDAGQRSAMSLKTRGGNGPD